MYNIAKVAKGEILLFFNEVFDALCKVGVPAMILNSEANLILACGRF